MRHCLNMPPTVAQLIAESPGHKTNWKQLSTEGITRRPKIHKQQNAFAKKHWKRSSKDPRELLSGQTSAMNRIQTSRFHLLRLSHTRAGFTEPSWTCPFNCELEKSDFQVSTALPHQDPTTNRWIRWVKCCRGSCIKWPVQTLLSVRCFSQNGISRMAFGVWWSPRRTHGISVIFYRKYTRMTRRKLWYPRALKWDGVSHRRCFVRHPKLHGISHKNTWIATSH